MAEHDRPLDRQRQHTVDAVSLFVVLMHAREAGRLQEAADACRKLDGLGVSVNFRPPRIRQNGGADV